MIVLLIVFVLVAFAIGLARRPQRALAAVMVAIVGTILLAEGADINARLALLLSIGAGFGVLHAGRGGGAKRPVTIDAPVAAETAWARLAGAAGFLTRQRVGTLRRRRDALVAAGEGVDPFSTFGELLLKLERRVPELIDNCLDEAVRSGPARRRAILGELLGDIEAIVARAEAADPTAIARDERRRALKAHLHGGSDRDPG